jgi:hypothetical protein
VERGVRRFSVAVEVPSSRGTVSTDALCSGNSRATALSLNACPYLATSFVLYRSWVFGSIEATTILTQRVWLFYPVTGIDKRDHLLIAFTVSIRKSEWRSTDDIQKCSNPFCFFLPKAISTSKLASDKAFMIHIERRRQRKIKTVLNSPGFQVNVQ